MRKIVAAALVTLVALLVPASAAGADPPRVEVHVLWPLCVTLGSSTICIPP